ncbi:MAG TPA: MmgE/PrpD family protein [Acetobacteraceae bacterium]|nr:MmgE/PrpD family protein [Acetobacteraceae bacterium]
MTVARQLAGFLTATSTADLPAQALDHAAMLIASTVASAARGTRLESARIIRTLACDRGGRPEASLWFDAGAKLPAADAAQANAVASDAAASDDSDLRNIVHAGTPLTATALAIAERNGAGGAEVLTAMVLGYEAAGRIGEAITPGFRNRGFHGCLGAIFAATVAAGHLLRLDAEHLAQAIALSATSIGGLATSADTSVAREYHAGLATMLGINAALAAQLGYRAEQRILETPKGFFEAFGGVDGATAGAAALRGLGESWDIVTDMAVKLVPGGHPHHATAEAAANAARAGNIAAAEVASITISRPGMTALPGPLHPADLIDMAHSPAYFAAAGVADHAFSWEHASAAKIADPVIHRLIDLVRVGAPPTEDAARYRQGATVTIHAHDGRVSASTVYVPKGAATLGIAWSDVDAKYRALVPASGLPTHAIEASLGLIHDFRHLAAVARLTHLIHRISRSRIDSEQAMEPGAPHPRQGDPHFSPYLSGARG